MAAAFRPKLGVNLQSIVAGDQPPLDMGDFTPGVGVPAKPQGGFFSDGGLGRLLAGAIGDALAQNAGMKPVFAPMQQRRLEMQQRQQEQEAEEVRWGRRLDDQFRNWQRQQEWTRDNVPEFDYIDDNAGNRWKIDKRTGAKTLMFVDPNDKQVVVDGQLVTIANRVRGGQAPAAAPQITEDMWNLGQPVGGGASNGVGGFPSEAFRRTFGR